MPFKKIKPPGLVEDPRSDIEKAQDFQHEEIASGVITQPVDWREKPESVWKKYSIRDQNGSSSCCGQGAAKAIETFRGEVESAHPIYRARYNFPSEGMWLQDVGKICKEMGTTSEALDPSQKLTETQMNAPITVTTPIKVKNYVQFNPKDIDTIAGIIEANKHAILLVHGNVQEYYKSDVPVSNGKPVDFGHCIVGVDYFLYNGEKAILIDDSWGKFGQWGGQRVFTESYIKARVDGGMYFIPLTEPENVKPHYTFTKVLEWGNTGKDVIALQEILKYEGFFPVKPTGNFYNVTANSLKKWQVKHGILDFANETNMRNIRFGKKSITLMNALYF